MDFLFEIGLEEVPARMIAGAEAELKRRITALLERERLVGADAVSLSYSTPRRLAVLVPGVADKQEDLAEDLMGPATKIAYKDGIPGPAAVAFAKKAGVDVSALRKVETPKGEYLAATSTRPGRTAAEVLQAELPKELTGIYWAKNMYWRAGKPERFVRPVRWMAALLGEAVVPVEFGGYTAGRLTYGHRVLHGAAPIELHAPQDYLQALTQASVMADVELRRHTIRKALDRVCRTLPETRWREDHVLVDKMTHLTEWPSVIAGGFEPAYLTLPEEILVTVMRDHQNYFAVESATNLGATDLGAPGLASETWVPRKLAPHFLAVLNTAATPEGEAVIRHGNERVLRARFNDARFFWEFDQRVPLMDRVTLLENVTFQKDLGSYAAKSERVRVLSAELAAAATSQGAQVDAPSLETAARLAKTDLTAELVKEFTELQGIVGGLYARAQGLPEAAAAAIYDHYLPASMEDAVPRTPEGVLLSIAYKADTIAGMFGLGLEPTGSKDPYALRRAANGIVKMLAETSIPLTLGEIAFLAAKGQEELVRRIELFFAERLEFYLREARQQAYDVVKAVLAVRTNSVRDAIARAEAVTAVRGSADFEAVSSAFKRMGNILAQAQEKGIAAAPQLDVSHLKDGAELELASRAAELKPQVEALRASGGYRQALEAIATLRPQVDAFFDAVMVMDPDPAIRSNRLALLERVLGDFGGIADFREIVAGA